MAHHNTLNVPGFSSLTPSSFPPCLAVTWVVMVGPRFHTSHTSIVLILTKSMYNTFSMDDSRIYIYILVNIYIYHSDSVVQKSPCFFWVMNLNTQMMYQQNTMHCHCVAGRVFALDAEKSHLPRQSSDTLLQPLVLLGRCTARWAQKSVNS